jgi:hypothetical protein
MTQSSPKHGAERPKQGSGCCFCYGRILAGREMLMWNDSQFWTLHLQRSLPHVPDPPLATLL